MILQATRRDSEVSRVTCERRENRRCAGAHLLSTLDYCDQYRTTGSLLAAQPSVRGGTKVHGPNASARPKLLAVSPHCILRPPRVQRDGGRRAYHEVAVRPRTRPCVQRRGNGRGNVATPAGRRAAAVVMTMTVTSERPVRGEGTAGWHEGWVRAARGHQPRAWQRPRAL